MEASLQSLSILALQLPNTVILDILYLLPPEQLVWARFINKAAYHEFSSCRTVSASYHELPLWTLRRMYAANTEEQQRPLLVRYRAAAGDVAAIHWLKSSSLTTAASWSPLVCAAAAGEGHLHALKCLRSGQKPCAWDHTACTAAAAGGHLSTLEWLRTQEPRCPWAGGDVWAAAAANGHFNILHYLLQQHCPGWDSAICTAAARAGRVDVLSWLRLQDKPCPYDNDVFVVAVAGGHVNVLDWYWQQEGGRVSIKDRAMACTTAARAGHLEVLEWLYNCS